MKIILNYSTLMDGGFYLSFLKSTFHSWEKICHGFLPFFSLYSKFYTGLVKKEVFLGGIGSKDVVLNIGCGAVPFTAINIVELTGAKVIAMDKDTAALEKAGYSLKRFKRGRNIELMEGDGQGDFSFDFTAAVVALHAEPKVKILENLMQKAGKGARLLFRQPKEAFKTQYGYLPESYPPDSEVKHGMKTIGKSLLYVKVDSGAKILFV